MRNASLITAAIMMMASEQLIGIPEAKTSKAKIGNPTDADFARMNKESEGRTQLEEFEMKLEIEITEAEIKSAIERKTRVAIADETNSWGNESAIKGKVRLYWQETMEQVVKDELAKSDQLRVKVQAAIEAKLKGQITALMRGK